MGNIHLGYFIGGLFCLSNAVYGFVTGSMIGFDLVLISQINDQGSFNFALFGSFLLGSVLFFRSFLAIANNREFHETKEEPYYEDTSVDLVNIIKLLLIMLAMVALVIFLTI